MAHDPRVTSATALSLHGLACLAWVTLAGVGCGGPTSGGPNGAGPTSSAAPSASSTAQASASQGGPRATCAGRAQCPADAPVCIVEAAGPSCVAAGSPRFLAVPQSARWACTLQSDCPADQGCFAPWADDAPTRSACGSAEVLQSAPATAFCDAADKCKPGDAECSPCKSADVKGLPWVGTYQ
jgi:hypothetical protein